MSQIQGQIIPGRVYSSSEEEYSEEEEEYPEPHRAHVVVRVPPCPLCGKAVAKSDYVDIGCEHCASKVEGQVQCRFCRKRTPFPLPDLSQDHQLRIRNCSTNCARCYADERYNRDVAIIERIRDDLYLKKLQPEQVFQLSPFLLQLLKSHIIKSPKAMEEFERLRRLWEVQTSFSPDPTLNREDDVRARHQELDRIKAEERARAQELARIKAEEKAELDRAAAEEAVRTIPPLEQARIRAEQAAQNKIAQRRSRAKAKALEQEAIRIKAAEQARLKAVKEKERQIALQKEKKRQAMELKKQRREAAKAEAAAKYAAKEAEEQAKVEAARLAMAEMERAARIEAAKRAMAEAEWMRTKLLTPEMESPELETPELEAEEDSSAEILAQIEAEALAFKQRLMLERLGQAKLVA